MRMKSLTYAPGMSGLLAVAGLSAMFLANCNRSENPVTPQSAAEAPEAQQGMPMRMAPEPRKATPAEVQEMMAARRAQDVPNPATAALPPAGAGTLAKTAALPPCVVNFNQPVGLSYMSDHAKSGFATSPFYMHWCNDNGYLMKTYPINLDHYHLYTELANTCSGSGLNLGIKSGSDCIAQSDAKNWPRFASNMNYNTGVGFWLLSNGNVQKNFDLRYLSIRSGTAEVWIYKVGANSGWHYYPELGPGTWNFTLVGTSVSAVEIYDSGKNGVIHFDNLDIAVLP